MNVITRLLKNATCVLHHPTLRQRIAYIRYDRELAEVALSGRPDRQHLLEVKKNITNMARDMMAGSFFSDTGITIKFNQHGELIDGQNRLLALIRAGAEIEMLTVFDIPDAHWMVIDTGGRTRSPSMVMRAEGKDDAPHYASVIRLLWLYEQKLSLNSAPQITPTEMERAAVEREHFDVFEVKRIQRFRAIAGRSLTLVEHLLKRKYEPGKVMGFFEQIREGLGVSPTDPAVVLSRRFMQPTVKRMSAGETAHLTRHAFQAYLHGRELKTVICRNPDALLEI